nr:unnamed protein product [Digitaria exilis]
MRVAVVGAGVSGLAAAHELARSGGGVRVTVYEKEDCLGGHARTVAVEDAAAGTVHLDLGFMVFNRVTYPNMLEWFEELGVGMEISDMSFSVSTQLGTSSSRCEWGSRNGISGLLAQKSNAISPSFWRMIHEILKFKNDALKYLEDCENNPDIDRNETLGQFIQSHGYSQFFQEAYLIPICACIWSCPSQGVLGFSAFFVLSFCRNHHLLQLFGRPQWLTVKGRSHTYVQKVREELESMGCQIKTSCEIKSVSSSDGGLRVTTFDGSEEPYDRVIFGVHAPDALKLLGAEATHEELRILGAFQYVYSDIYLHCDKSMMPRNSSAWSSWNFMGTTSKGVCVTYWLNLLQVGYGFHEDGLKAGKSAAQDLLGKKSGLLVNPKQMVPSWTEAGARLLVARFLGQYVSVGNLVLLEEGGTMFSFGEVGKKCHTKSVLRVHDPMFYWKVATEADLGLADAYINGYFSFVDKREGLLNLFLSNEFFSLFLDPSMTYSCAIFKTEDESLEAAQLRKVCLLIDKAKVERDHHVLEIGCGWGSLAVQLVKQTGCKYTGVTLSVEQLKYAQRKVKEAGLEDHISFMLCDYRQIPTHRKYDRIISCEMIEGVGHEYMDDFFGCCESLLAQDGLFVLQFISIPEERYEEYRRSSDFIKEYIFPGGCLPSLARITSAMSTASRLCIEHLENIGYHYYPTLIRWRDNFMANKDAILALGFDEKFIRIWEYYFIYCAAGFKSRTLGNYQIVFSRPGNDKLGDNDPYASFPAANNQAS